MEKEIIPVTFSALRQLSEEVMRFTTEKIWIPDNGISLRSSLNDDFGIAGLDIEEFLLEFSEQYQVNLEGLNFYEYFIGEGGLIYVYGDIRDVIFLPFIIVYKITEWLIVVLIRYCFSKQIAIAFEKYANGVFYKITFTKPLLPFTVADLITCAVTRKFRLRKQVYYKLMEPGTK